jgi:hypothetical protein
MEDLSSQASSTARFAVNKFRQINRLAHMRSVDDNDHWDAVLGAASSKEEMLALV